MIIGNIVFLLFISNFLENKSTVSLSKLAWYGYFPCLFYAMDSHGEPSSFISFPLTVWGALE